MLINAASSSVGLAAIQIARMLNAIPVAMTRTSDKREMLLQAGAAVVLASQEQNIVEEIERFTGGKGIQLAFDPVGGPGVADIARVMSDGAFFFQYGALDSRDLCVPVLDILGKHLTFRGYELFEITTHSEKMARAKTFVSEGLRSGALIPLIDKTFPFTQIADAHRYMASNGQVGKIVVQVDA